MCFRLLTSAFVTVLINNIKNNPDPAVFISSLSMQYLKKPKEDTGSREISYWWL